MGFYDDLAGVAAEPEMFRLATRRAGSRELAEVALQETVRAITERKCSKVIGNLRGFFYVSLIREIDHQPGRPAARREHGTRSAARPQEDARKEFKVVLDLGLLATAHCARPYLETGADQAMREHPTTDRVVRHRTDALPEGEPWISMKISRR